MFFEEKLCIPMSFQIEMVNEYNQFLGHVGPDSDSAFTLG
jgi:hypothetical protein